MTELVLLLLGLGSGAFVIWPLLREARRPWVSADAPSGVVEALRQEELLALEALRDLATDLKLGNLAEPDYRSLAAPLRARLQRAQSRRAEAEKWWPDGWTIPPGLDRLLEDEILAMRRVHPHPAAGPMEAGMVRRCPTCATPAAPEHRFCAACGTALPPVPDDRPEGPGPATAVSPSPTLGPDVLPWPDLPTPTAEATPTVPPISLPEGQAADTGRRRYWWGMAVALALAWVVVVVGLYLSGRNRQLANIPVAQFETPIQAIAAGGEVWMVATGDGVQRSGDGRRWVHTGLAEAAQAVVALDTAGTSWLAATGTELWRSDDGGNTWRPAVGNGQGFVTLASAPRMGMVWGLAGDALYASEDGGASWTLLSDRLPGQGQALAVGPGELYLGTDRGVFLSRDGGQAWAGQNGMVNGRIVSLDIRALAYDGDNRLLYAGTPAGLSFLNTARGGGWGQRALQGVVTALWLAGENGQMLWAGTEDGRLFLSPNRGVTWR